MKTIVSPSLDAEDTYETVSGARSPQDRRIRLIQAKPLIYAAYDAYGSARDDVTALDPAVTTPATRHDLKGNYRYITRSARQFRASIFQGNPGGRCPMCGQGRASTLDHYLPTAVFPEFSILPINLIPTCYDCNKEKGTRYASDGALFLHAYLDDIPTDERFLFADVYLSDGHIGVSFSVTPPESMNADLARRIHSHFEELGLASYYMREGINEISERTGALSQMIAEGRTESQVQDYLLAEADSIARDKGTNFWRYALLDAMANSRPICTGAFLNA